MSITAKDLTSGPQDFTDLTGLIAVQPGAVVRSIGANKSLSVVGPFGLDRLVHVSCEERER